MLGIFIGRDIKPSLIWAKGYLRFVILINGDRFIPPMITHTMLHYSLGQVLIRQGWEASLPNVGLSKSVQVGVRVDPTHPKEDNT